MTHEIPQYFKFKATSRAKGREVYGDAIFELISASWSERRGASSLKLVELAPNTQSVVTHHPAFPDSPITVGRTIYARLDGMEEIYLSIRVEVHRVVQAGMVKHELAQ